MYRIIFLLFFLPVLGYAQSFVVTPDGLRDANNMDNAYVVVEQDGVSAEELYNNTIRYINQNMKNPESSIKSEIKGDYIRYSVYVPDFIKYSNSGAKIDIEAFFDVEFRFKDNRIRYEIVSLKMPSKKYKYGVEFKGSKWSSYPIYENNGKLFKENEKQDIELFFNTFLSDYISYLNDGSSKDDW